MTTHRYDKDEIKAAASNRWAEILTAIGGVPESVLDQKHHPCPRCNGKDRFRFISNETGAVICNKCFKGGDGIAVLRWLNGWEFQTTLRELACHLGMESRNGEQSDVSPLEAVAKLKRVSHESLAIYGATITPDFSATFPAYGPDGKQCTEFTVWPRDRSALRRKGKNAKGRKAGLFFPHEDGAVRLPKPGETWLVTEGVKDAAALHSLGYLAVGLNTCKLAQKFVRLFSGTIAVLVPDRDSAGIEGSDTSARSLYGVAESVAVAHLPADVADRDGVGVREIMAKTDGEDLVKQTITAAKLWHPEPDGDSLQEIIVGLDESRVANDVLQHLGGRGLYQRGGRLVHVTREQTAPNARIEVPDSLPRIRNLPAPLLRETISASVALVVPGDEEDKLVRPPKWLVDAIYERGQYPGNTVPPLAGIVRCPTIRPDGTVLQTPGYDRRSGLFYDPDGKYPPVPDAPTCDAAERAAQELLEVVCDFPFAAEEHKTVWLALPLTLIGRSAIAGPCPLFALDANTRGSGKSLMCDVAGVIAFGDHLPRKTWPRDDDETRKTITSVALEAIPAVLLDNVSSTLGSASLDAVLTGTTWTDRILGKSQTTGTLPLTAAWIATGNNLVLGADTARRSLYCRLETLEEHPEDREDFRHADLMAWVRGNRHRLAAAAVTVLRAYLAAELPDQGLKTWGSYEAWSKLIRGAIVWVGLPDPALTKMAVRDADRTAELLEMLLDGVAEADSGGGVTAGELAKLVQHPMKPDEPDPYPVLRAAVTELCGAKIDGRQIGYRLREYKGRVCGGRRLVHRKTAGIKRWRVDGVDPTPLSYARARVRTHTCARAPEAAETSTPSACNHQDPDAWQDRDGKAFCPGCDKFMGRYPT